MIQMSLNNNDQRTQEGAAYLSHLSRTRFGTKRTQGTCVCETLKHSLAHAPVHA